nr:galactoside 2-alpha-L-fucosyltransferase 1-like [Biomphalaria glabrata]
MHSVRELSKEVDLPQNRAALALHGASSPANAPGVPEVRKSLIDPEVNKKCTKTVLRNTARKTVAQYPADCIKVYTDGSTRENLGQKTSGYGVVVRFPGSTENDEILGACSGRSNYVAEMVAIQNAVEYIEERLNEETAQPSPIVLFTDSMSSLQAIESPADTLPEPLAKTLACVGRLQEKHKIRTAFQYVPGHVDVEGNMWPKSPLCGLLSNRTLQDQTIHRINRYQRTPTFKLKMPRHLSTIFCVTFVCINVFPLYILVKIFYFSGNSTPRAEEAPLSPMVQLNHRIGNQMFMYASTIGHARAQHRVPVFIEARNLSRMAEEAPLSLMVQLNHRIGNQMFMYASTFGLARAQHRVPVFIKGRNLSRIFKITSRRRMNSFKRWRVFKESSYAKFDSKLRKFPETNIFLLGFLQSWRYFHNVDDEIRREFTFVPSIQKKADVVISDYRSNVTNHVLVGVHVRRGDFLLPFSWHHGYRVAKASYFVKAFAKMRSLVPNKNLTFLVASDDLPWCRDNIKDASVKFLPNMTAEIHLAVLSRCDHVIITGGSFGWWIAWLANGITIYYKGFVKIYSPLEEGFSARDYYPPGWIGLP